MTIQEASQKKAELEKNLIEQFEKFEAETNMCVDSIDVLRHQGLAASEHEVAHSYQAQLCCRLK
jgi:hypothetical protein